MIFDWNFDLLSVGVTVSSIAILGFVVFFSQKKSATNRTFLFFSLCTIVYGTVNYLNYQVISPSAVLWLLRLTLFFAVWHAFSFFQLFFVFPKQKIKFPSLYKYVLIPWVILVAILTLSPLVFSGIEENIAVGQVTNPERGPGMAVFGATTVFLVIAGIFLLFKKLYRATGIAKIQFRFILIGVLPTFSLLILFNFVFPVIFNNLRFIPLAPVFFLPLVVFTFYAIIKHHLFNTKIIATEIITFLLVIISFFEVLFSRGVGEIFFRTAIFLGLLFFGILLIKSVLREVRQREALERLTKDLEHANRRLAELVKLKSEFLSIASHQLRTPTSIAKGMLSMVLDDTVKGAKREDFIKKSFQGVQRLERIIRDLLNASELEGEKMKLECKPVDLLPIMAEVVEERRGAADKKGLELIVKGHVGAGKDKKCPLVMADQVKIVEVVANLIDNATNYTPSGSITLWCQNSTDGKYLEIHVKDTGIGISKEDKAKLFKKFSRGERSPGINPNGSGLGLFIVKKIAEGCGGSITAKSAGVNKGSEFVISLRIA